MKVVKILFLALLIGVVAYNYNKLTQKPEPIKPTTIAKPLVSSPGTTTTPTPTPIVEQKVEIINPAAVMVIPQKKQVYQTFNNCGPATLSMALSYVGIDQDQKILGERLRPYQNSTGDNDDKNVFSEEFVSEAVTQGSQALTRVNGDITLLKTFITNNIPVVVKTWLNSNETIGHYRLVRGYDDNRQIIIADDSYQGPNREISYRDFNKMWQAFNYNYIVLYKKGDETTVKNILGTNWDLSDNYTNALTRAKDELTNNNDDIYARFNLSTSLYHLNKFEAAITEYEKIKDQLPFRMLWYQIEPILAYQKLEQYDKALSTIDKVLNYHNRAFAELYVIKGEILMKQGKLESGKEQMERAKTYKKNIQIPSY